MTDWSFESTEADFMDHASLPRKIFSRTVPVLAAVSFSAVVALQVAGGLASHAFKGKSQQAQQKVAAAPEIATTPPQAPALRAAVASELRPSSNPYGELLDPEPLKGASVFAEAKPIGADISLFQSEPMYKPEPEPEPAQVAEAALETLATPAAPEPPKPLAENEKGAAELGLRLAEEESVVPQPPIRPANLVPSRLAKVEDIKPVPAPERVAPQRLAPRVAARRLRGQPQMQAENDPRGFFEKLFGGDKAGAKGPQLAYAAPDGGSSLHLPSSLFAAARPSSGVAVYNIAAHTVTLPSGAQLEAHSGLGPYFDNPEGVHIRMKGSTPPATYKLSLRESLFHGVQALRLTPIEGNVHGRSGLLAHTFMLGPRGDSNGCVSFRNYRAFLEAYRNGEFSQLRVVSGG